MFDIGFWEISLIAVISLLILGPERLPQVARTAGMWVGKMKKMVADVKSNINEELRMEELNALKQAGQDLKEGLTSTQRELSDAGSEFKKSVEVDAGADEKVDIAAAINQSVPEPDEQTTAKSDSGTGPAAVKLKTSRKKAKKTAKRTDAQAPKTKKTARKTSASAKADGGSKVKKKVTKRTLNKDAGNQTSQ